MDKNDKNIQHIWIEFESEIISDSIYKVLFNFSNL